MAPLPGELLQFWIGFLGIEQYLALIAALSTITL